MLLRKKSKCEGIYEQEHSPINMERESICKEYDPRKLGDFNRESSKGRTKEKSKRLFMRKEILDHAVIYTTNKIDENSLIHYIKGFYVYFKKEKQSNDYGRNLNEEIYITLEDWLTYNELVKNQDNNLLTLFSSNVCKSLWILLCVTVQSVRKKNNVNKQKTIFNTPLEELYTHGLGKNLKGETHATGVDTVAGIDKTEEVYENGDKSEGNTLDVWGENWMSEHVCIELVIFFIILQFLKIDHEKKKYDKILSEECWPHFIDSPRSASSGGSSGGGSGGGSGGNGSVGSTNSSMCKSNLSDFFSICGKSYKHFLKTYLIAFFSCTDITNSTTLTDIPLYFRSYHFLLLDFIIDTNDHTNVYEQFLQHSEHKILYKTRTILTWLLRSLCIVNRKDDHDESGTMLPLHLSTDEKNSSNKLPTSRASCTPRASRSSRSSDASDISDASDASFSPRCENGSLANYGIEEINDDIYEIENMVGRTLYIDNGKSIINISNCRECNIFILSSVEYLKISLCEDCYIISLSVEMIATLFSSNGLDVHLVTRSLKIENVIDTDVYVYTETNIIIFGDTRNIQLAPYNILNGNQKECLEKSKIFFNEKNCELFAFPLKCKTSLSHSQNGCVHLQSSGLSPNPGGNNDMSNGEFSDGKRESGSDRSGSGSDSGGSGYRHGRRGRHRDRHWRRRDCNGKDELIAAMDACTLSSSFTDYVYYLLDPSKFSLVEFAHSDFLCKSDIDNTPIEDISWEDLYRNSKVSCNMSDYVNKGENDKYVCLYLPEVYKNSIERQDEHILSFLNFMESIKLTKSQREKVTKILTYKLYEYTMRSKKVCRALGALVDTEHDTQEVNSNEER
ncbi:conserved Plasmodium protein, unknown function [Plasmodium ovale]|uniref:C-CAP/cofactor C-like domain-containing protein n=2 Tax=Plasmodium ovale TaxID=36330 RepID=A0A1A8W5K7_PLAOA|nr:conserved Plasmodium protein, unknown function [Plasmodium ovale curtisi]SBS97302.1 conserved Plasmodium protein, unknown function [Plasmodium ovale curtisi]SCP05963.1 conserved Plasmodium protein, unknown function [Plasmodium ovale]